MNHKNENYWSSWSGWSLPEWICKKLKIQPGEYMIKYNSATGDLIIKDPHNQQKKEFRVNLYNLLPENINQEQKEALELLHTPKRHKSLGGGYCNHHIIPHQLCRKHPLIREATRYGVFKKDGDENLMPLPKNFHKKNHTKGSPYYTLIQDILDGQWARIKQDNLDTDPDEIKQTILEIVETTKDHLTELLKIPRSTIRDDFPSPDYPDSWLRK
jgi:hypothetical protein